MMPHETPHERCDDAARLELTPGVTLSIEPRAVQSREAFLAGPPYAVALDGAVEGPPFLERTSAGPYANFNHHERVERAATRATCEQVQVAFALGDLDAFRDARGRRQMHVLVNDDDQDVCTSTWLLAHPGRCAEPGVNRLVRVEGLLDMSAGFYPFDADLPYLEEVMWMFTPYTRTRDGAPKDAATMRAVIEDVHARINAHLAGRGGRLPLEGSYERTSGGAGWALIERERGPYARLRMRGEGITAIVSVAPRPDGRWRYSLAKSGAFVPFPLETLYAALNAAEDIHVDDQDRWGGGSTTGGSPRIRGSRLLPEQVSGIVEAVLHGAAVRAAAAHV